MLAMSVLDSVGEEEGGENISCVGGDDNNDVGEILTAKSISTPLSIHPHTKTQTSAVCDVVADRSHTTSLTTSTDSTNKNNKTTPTPLSLHTLPFDLAVDRAVWAVRHAAARDGYSGGAINVVVVNSTGVFHVRRVEASSMRLRI
jgi:Na+-translocating ferredoxin:NAD+ oxidoreductase RnfG subunit